MTGTESYGEAKRTTFGGRLNKEWEERNIFRMALKCLP